MLGAWGLQRPGFIPVPFSVRKNMLINYPFCSLPFSTECQALEGPRLPGQVCTLGLYEVPNWGQTGGRLAALELEGIGYGMHHL